MNQFSVRVIPTGFEPVAYCLEGSCSIQLSYCSIRDSILSRINLHTNFHLRNAG
jgi:hypothetical protein